MAVLSWLPYVFSLFAIVGFIIAAALVGSQAKTIEQEKKECYECWYKERQHIVAMMVIMVFVTMSLAYMYNRSSGLARRLAARGRELGRVMSQPLR